MNDIMIDIETLGTRPTSVITQIGACYFDRYTGEIGSTFIANIRIQDCLDKGLTVDGDNIKWWFEQPVDKTFLDSTSNLSVVLDCLRQFINKKSYIWSHATFDIPVIANAYRAIGQGLPFSYRNTRDIRTLVHLSNLPYNKPKDDKTHNALDDCFYQVKYCVKCFNKLNRR